MPNFIFKGDCIKKPICGGGKMAYARLHHHDDDEIIHTAARRYL